MAIEMLILPNFDLLVKPWPMSAPYTNMQFFPYV